jgi:hypothetical protein
VGVVVVVVVVVVVALSGIYLWATEMYSTWMELLSSLGIRFEFACAAPRPCHLVFVADILSVCSNCLSYFVLVRLTSGLSVEKGLLEAVGNTPNVLSGQPQSPKSSKNKRWKGKIRA